MELHGPRVTLRSILPEDLQALRAIVRQPSVAKWWGPPKDDATLDRDLIADGVAFTIRLRDEIVGWVQYYEETDPDYRHAGMDISLAETAQDRGLGSETLRVLARWLVAERGHHRFIIDPAVANERAVRTYERVGFKRVGVMRRYERGPDGTWHDSLLMDMLADEITADPQR